MNPENQYYPTPESLIQDIIWDFKFKNNFINEFRDKDITFLEPCAGDGAICRVIKEFAKDNDLNISINCIEIEPTLRNSLKGQGFNVIGKDFLEFKGFPIYDLIVMNPPFNKGDKFILKAYELLAGGGSLICILNSETIKNPFSQDRKTLKNLIDRVGDVEFLQDAFNCEDSERKTDVEIAVVYLRKPIYESEFDLFGNIKTLEQDQSDFDFNFKKSDNLAPSADLTEFNEIDSAISIYRNCIKTLFQGIDTIHKIREGLTYLSKESEQFGISTSQLIKDILESRDPDSAKEEITKKVRKMVWSYVFEVTKSDRYLFYKQLQKFYSMIDSGSKDLPFTKENIKQFLENLFIKRHELFKEGVKDLFEEITKYHSRNPYGEGWKTNKNWKITKKIIVPWALYFESYSDDRGYFSTTGLYERNWIDDLDKIVRMIEPSGRGTITIKDALKYKFNQLGTIYKGSYFENTTETYYFDLKFFKKGTLHIVFKDDKVLDELNRIGGQLRKELGYDV